MITGALIGRSSLPDEQFFRKIAPKFVRIYVFFKKIMGSTRSHPLPPGIFVQMPSPPLARSDPSPAWYANAETIVASSEFVGWTDRELIKEINRLREMLQVHDESKRLRETRVDYETVVLDGDDDDDDIMNDPDIRKMVENGEHTCHMFDAHCQACEDDEDEDEDEDEEVRVLTEEEVQNDPEMTAQVDKADHLRAHFC